MTDTIYKELIKITAEDRVFLNESMSKHTTFKIGGTADIYVSIKDCKEAENVIRLLSMNEVPHFIIGNGSNLLVSDDGYRGVIVEIGKDFSDITVEGDEITASAGALLIRIASEAYKNSLTGFEFASGIPGTLGGGVFMNAGAYGGELKDVITEVTLLDLTNGKTIIKSCDEMDFSYRHSIVKEQKLMVLSAKIKLSMGSKEEIKNRMDELKQQRNTKQPLEFPSAGSTFKRPEGYFAGKLIQDAGLKGYTVGGAQVSEKHSGFVINKGNATAEDVITLIKDVRDIVNDKFGVVLEPEVCMLSIKYE